ncbi:MAG: helix-turn-helix transcriptional regulator [Verrucomicrobiota bacterium]|jgi:AraC-like DNA-binding protein|nr:helix-turn-helix transcriptional regulator [Verrucomicrobiota bacterium]
MILVQNGKVVFDSARRFHDPVSVVEMAFRCSYKVNSLSALLGVSARHLERMFYETLGISPKAWLREQRMVRARYLLREGFPLKHISVFLGFKRYTHFISEVQAFYGVSPVEMVDMEKKRCNRLDKEPVHGMPLL